MIPINMTKIGETICDECECAGRCEQDEAFICPYDDNEPTNSVAYILWD